jgi:cytoskeletal protein RodZ
VWRREPGGGGDANDADEVDADTLGSVSHHDRRSDDVGGVVPTTTNAAPVQPIRTTTVTVTRPEETVTETTPTEPVTVTAPASPVTVTATQTVTNQVTTTAATVVVGTTTTTASPAATVASKNSETGSTDSTQWGWIVFAILALAVIVGGLVYWLRGRGGKPPPPATPPA